MRKKFTTFLLILFTFPAFTQTVDDIIKKNIEARGGYEKLKKLKTIKTEGLYIIGEEEVEFTMYQKRPNLIRQEGEYQGQKIIRAYDGKIAWTINPLMGSPDPQSLSGFEAEEVMAQSDFEGDIVDYKKKGNRAELIGKEEMEGTEVYKLRVTRKNGDVIYHYLDTDYCIELKSTVVMNINGEEVELDNYYSDYKEVDGVMIPHSIEGKIGGYTQYQIVIDQVDFNVDVDDEIFRMPQESKIEH